VCKLVCNNAERSKIQLLLKRRRCMKKTKNHPLFLKIAKLAALRQRNFLNEKAPDFLHVFFLRRCSFVDFISEL